MTDENAVQEDATQADADTQAQAADTQRPGGADDHQTDDDTDALSPETARKLRSEAKQLRKRLQTAEGELKKRQDTDLTDQERLTKQHEELKTQIGGLEHDNRTLRVQVAASKLGILDPDAASRLIDWDTVDDPSDQKQVVRALKALVSEKPWLAGTSSGADGGAGRDARGSADLDMNAVIRRAAGVTG